MRHREGVEMLRCCKDCPKPPVVRKCCFCVPVRRGVTIFGYVNLVLSLLSFPLLVFLLVEEMTTGRAVGRSDYMDPMVHLPLTIAFVVVDVIMTVVLLVGAHKKKLILLKVYLYFEVFFQLVTLCIDLVYFDYREYVENTLYFLFLGLNVYLVFLVYNTVRVIEETNEEVQYVTYTDHTPSPALKFTLR